MRPEDIIRKKRFGLELDGDDIAAFARGACDGSFADYQLSALLMAICINGMSDCETVDLTLAMARTGDTLDLGDVPGVKVDKHSTGGVADTTTLILAPLVAACGVKVAKMSGRGLGFTGGTLDKLESIPGMRVFLPLDRFKENVRRVGLAVVGQTERLAPADKTLYSLRDVTATVDCQPLIISSILSKKIAAGCDVVVLDVKYGAGALMKRVEDAEKLARDMVRIGNMSGKRFSALVTSMAQPLGANIGNAMEVEEAIDVLSGRAGGDLLEVTLRLGAKLLAEAGIADGERIMREKLASGEALAKFAEFVDAQDGDARVAYDVSLLPRAQYGLDIRATRSGYLRDIDSPALGEAARSLGGGRTRKEDVIDPAVGLKMRARLGDYLRAGDVLAEIMYNPTSDIASAKALAEGAFAIGDAPNAPARLIEADI